MRRGRAGTAAPLAAAQVLRAKVSLLEGRAHNSLALVPANAAPAGLPAAHAAATEQVEQLRARLAVAAEKLESREATCRKYKVRPAFPLGGFWALDRATTF